jgi:hypothetical protein
MYVEINWLRVVSGCRLMSLALSLWILLPENGSIVGALLN